MRPPPCILALFAHLHILLQQVRFPFQSPIRAYPTQNPIFGFAPLSFAIRPANRSVFSMKTSIPFLEAGFAMPTGYIYDSKTD